MPKAWIKTEPVRRRASINKEAKHEFQQIPYSWDGEGQGSGYTIVPIDNGAFPL